MIAKQLQRFFIKMLIPAVLLAFAVEAAKTFGLVGRIVFSGNKLPEIVLFVLAASGALAVPLLYRTLFIARVRTFKNLPAKDFIRFQKRTLAIVLSSCYFFVVSALVQVSDLVYFALFFLALYGAYFYFPSQKRIDFEMRLFRVKE